MMDIRDDGDGVMAELEAPPGFALRVTERVAELERIRGIAQEQSRQVWHLLVACIAGSLLLGWLVTVPLLPAAGALLHTAYHLLDEVGARSIELTPLPLLIGLLLGTAMGLVWSAKGRRRPTADAAT